MAEIDSAPDPTASDVSMDDSAPAGEGFDIAPNEPGLEITEGSAEECAAAGVISIPGGPTLEVEAKAGAPADAGFILDAIQNLAERLGGRLDALQTTFDRELRAEANRERVIDRLHSELQEYKHDLLLKVQRPIFVDLIQLHDDIGKMIDSRSITGADQDGATVIRGVIESIQTAIEDILYRQGVEPFMIEGDEFDPRKQRAVSTQATADPSLNKKVASRLRKGFQAGDKVIRPEVVTVFTHRSAPAITPG